MNVKHNLLSSTHGHLFSSIDVCVPKLWQVLLLTSLPLFLPLSLPSSLPTYLPPSLPPSPSLPSFPPSLPFSPSPSLLPLFPFLFLQIDQTCPQSGQKTVQRCVLDSFSLYFPLTTSYSKSMWSRFLSVTVSPLCNMLLPSRECVLPCSLVIVYISTSATVKRIILRHLDQPVSTSHVYCHIM